MHQTVYVPSAISTVAHVLSAVFANHKQVEGGALSEADQRQPPVSKDLPRPMVPFSRDELPGICAMQASAAGAYPAVTCRLARHCMMGCPGHVHCFCCRLWRAAAWPAAARCFTASCGALGLRHHLHMQHPLPWPWLAGGVQAHCQEGERV